MWRFQRNFEKCLGIVWGVVSTFSDPRYASERLRGDYELVEAAVEQDGLVMLIENCIPKQYSKDPRLFLVAGKSNRLAVCTGTGSGR